MTASYVEELGQQPGISRTEGTAQPVQELWAYLMTLNLPAYGIINSASLDLKNRNDLNRLVLTLSLPEQDPLTGSPE